MEEAAEGYRGYTVVETPPAPEEFLTLRREAGLSPRSLEGVRIGLPGSWYGVHIKSGEKTVAMGRIAGDGGITFQVVDIAVLPEYQGRGLGKLVMDLLMKYYDENAPEGSLLTLLADGDARFLYEGYGFREAAPESVGMIYRGGR